MLMGLFQVEKKKMDNSLEKEGNYASKSLCRVERCPSGETDLRYSNNFSIVIKAAYRATTASKLEDSLLGRCGTSLLTAIFSMN